MSLNTKLSRRHAMALLASSTLPVLAQMPAFPVPGKTVKIVVPFAAGAGTDAMGRLMAQRLGEVMNATFVVENRTDINSEQMDKLATPLAKTGYGQYLKRLLVEGKRSEEMFMRRQGDLQTSETGVEP